MGPALLQRGCRYVGVDVAETAVRHAQGAGLDAQLIKDGSELPFEDGEFDAAFMVEVLEHLFAPHLAVAEVQRVLRPGGTLLVTTPNRLTFSPGRDTPLNPFHTRELDPRELAGLVGAAGFGHVDVRGLHHGPRLRERDRRHGGLVEAQLAVALGAPWPAGLRADVAAVRAEDFRLTPDDLDASLDLLVTATA